VVIKPLMMFRIVIELVLAIGIGCIYNLRQYE